MRRDASPGEVRSLFPISHSERLVGSDEQDRRTKTFFPRLEIIAAFSRANAVLQSRIEMYRRLLGQKEDDLTDEDIIRQVPALQVRASFIRNVAATLGSYQGFLPKVSARAEDMTLDERAGRVRDRGTQPTQPQPIGANGVEPQH